MVKPGNPIEGVFAFAGTCKHEPLREDPKKNPDLLYLGTELGFGVISIDAKVSIGVELKKGNMLTLPFTILVIHRRDNRFDSRNTRCEAFFGSWIIPMRLPELSPAVAPKASCYSSISDARSLITWMMEAHTGDMYYRAKKNPAFGAAIDFLSERLLYQLMRST